ncbi:MAG: cytochrome c [Sphingobacteriales bacterium]|nr:cytochrome c [Sphingobacteriales bacterium]MBI3717215.1 cytochrome c [Sphingobacteriales bacterium]RTL58952.1 MAG: cytochrome c [Sphingobacteriales bacterium]
MKLKQITILTLLLSGTIITLIACGSGGEKKTTETTQPAATTTDNAQKEKDNKRGIGKFTKVDIPATLDKAMADAGNKIYDTKCMSCHRLTDEKLVGPGWKGVTSRRTPEWIMNFATNTDEMLANDPQAQALLETCLVRMPNQSLTDDDARHVYEFMRKNDGVK